MDSPKLRRDVELVPVQHQGRKLFAVRDHLELFPRDRALEEAILPLLVLLDGSRTCQDIQLELTRSNRGMLVTSQDVEQLLNQLDSLYLLDSRRYREARKAIEDEFSSQPVRMDMLSGNSYPKEPGELTTFLKTMLSGHPRHRSGGTSRAKAIVAPHIDFQCAGGIYASAYGQFPQPKPERVVVLGIGHQMDGGLFCLTHKGFQTPLGIMENDAPSFDRLKNTGAGCLCQNDFPHRAEHSIEFQVLLLQHLLAGEKISVTPILCGSLAALPEYSRGSFQEEAGSFLSALRQIVASPSTLVIAGVDLSHIGPKFGHRKTASELESLAENHDRALLEALVSGDPDAFWAESRRVRDSFHVCGFSALACLMEILPEARGEVLDYRMWHEEPTASAVSCAAAVLTE